MYLSLALLRFLQSLPSALAVGLLLLPRLINEDGARFKPAVAALGVLRALLGFALLYLTARAIIPAERPIDFDTLWTFTLGTMVGKAWAATQIIAFIFAGLAIARLFVTSDLLDRITLWAGVAVIAVVSVTGHAIDDGLPAWTKGGFLLHTAAGLTWFGGLLGLVWWMFTAHNKPPEVAARLSERWSIVAKIAMGLVVLSGFALAWESVGSIPNMLATPYGRLLTFKLASLCAVLFCALALVRYMGRAPAGTFDVAWYAKVGAIEAAFGVVLLFIAGYIAVITPASHETDLYWPLPFRLSWAATWGFVGTKLPWIDTPGWYLAPAWSGVVAAVFLAVAAAVWWAPATRKWRRWGAPAALALAAAGVFSSFTTVAYTDTYADPTVDYTAASVARGLKTYAESCTGCHGAQGEGNGPLATGLKDAKGALVPPADLTAPHVGNHTIGDIFHWLTSGGTSGVMPGFKDQLDTDDRWDLINFLLMLSYSNRARFMGAHGQVQWLIAPDFPLNDPTEKATTLFKLRGTPTLVSFARCTAQDEAGKELAASLIKAAETTKTAGANHVTVYTGDCPKEAAGRAPTHPKAVEKAYSVINRYPNESYSEEIPEAHYLIDRSGYVRARFRHFGAADASATQLMGQVASLAKEPLVEINLHSH